MERWCGVPERDLAGRTLFDVNPNFKREAVAEPLQRLLRGDIDELQAGRRRARNAPWRARRLERERRASFARPRLPAGAVLLIEDITERRGLERAARQSEKLAALGDAGRRSRARAEQSDRHHLVARRADAARCRVQSPCRTTSTEDLRVIHRHAQRVARIAQGLLSFARSRPASRGRVDLNRVVDETLLLVEKTIVKDGVTGPARADARICRRSGATPTRCSRS